MLGANTDPYQPVEKRLRVTREILEVMLETRHPVSIITKGTLVLRDLDLLRELNAMNLVQPHGEPHDVSIPNSSAPWSRAPPRPRGGCE